MYSTDHVRNAGLAFLFAFVPGSASAQTFLMDNTPVTTCMGVFTDSGGAGGNYENNETFIKTFTPGVPGMPLVVDFVEFDVEAQTTCNFDRLTIYDGNSTAAPIIGSFCNTTGSPGLVISTATDGSLTFEFSSDISVTDPGWVANIFCSPPDDCSEAIPIGNGAINGFWFGTSPDGSSSCDTVAGSDRWYSYTNVFSGTGMLTVDTVGTAAGSGADTVLSLHDASCPGNAGNQIACDDDLAMGTTDSMVSTALAPGQTVLIRVADNGAVGSMDAYILNVAFTPDTIPLTNDDCANAIPVSDGTILAGTLAGATTDGDASCGLSTSSPDVWFTFTAGSEGILNVSTCGSHDIGGVDQGLDTVLSLHSGGCPGDTMNQLECDDDNGPPTCPSDAAGLMRDSIVETNLVAGDTVLIRVSNFNNGSTSGNDIYILRVEFSGTSPFIEGCNGDGGDQVGCTPCPCGNDAPQGTIGGCTNSAGTASRLIASGSTSVGIADLRFEASGVAPSNSCVLTSGGALAPANMANPCFGLGSGIQSVNLDGLRCAVQGVLRHGVRPSDPNGDVGVTTNGWGTPNGFFNFAAFMTGDTRHFQIIHRDDAAQVCTTGQNTSQSVSLTFTM